MTHLRLTRNQSIGFFAASMLLYGMLFFFLEGTYGPGFAALSILPVASAGWFLGLWGGFLAGIYSLPVNLILLYLTDRSDFVHFFQHGGGIGTVAIIAVGVLAGKLGDLQRKLLENIVERRAVEKELRKLTRSVTQSPISIMITDTQGNLEYVNPKFTQLTGYSAEEVIGKNPRFLQSGQKSRPEYQQLWNTILSGKEWYGTFHNKKKDGTLYWESATISPVFDENGAITNFIALKEDITERKKREREMEALSNISAVLRMDRPSEILSIIQEQLVNLLRLEGVAFVLRHPGSMEVEFERGGGTWKSVPGVKAVFGEGITEKVIETGQPYIHSDAPAGTPSSPRELFSGLPAVACLPLVMNGHNLGAIWVGRQTAIQENEIRTLTSIADMAANAIHRDLLLEQTKRHLRQVRTLHSIDLAINASLDLRVTFDIILTQVSTQLGVDAADIFVLNSKTKVLSCIASHGFLSRPPVHSQIRLDEGCVGRAAFERRTIFTEVIRGQSLDSMRPELAGEGFRSCICTPLIARGVVMGVLELFHRTPIQPAPDWLNFLEAIAVQAANAIDNSTLFNNLQQSNSELILAYDATIEGWSRALDLRDRETEGHSQRVMEMTMRLAKAMGVGDDDLVNIRRGALLHDIGKMGIPDKILLKPELLTEEEWGIMRRHPAYAYELLSPIAYLKPALDIPYCHHENWDGSGYPRGLKGEEIPLPARIFSVVDNWDALSSDRPYRPAWEPEDILQYLRANQGVKFDPRVVDEFLEMVEAGSNLPEGVFAV